MTGPRSDQERETPTRVRVERDGVERAGAAKNGATKNAQSDSAPKGDSTKSGQKKGEQKKDKDKLRAPALRRTLGLLRPHLPGHRLLLGGGALALVFEVLFRVLEPWPVKFVVDAVTRSLGADLSEPGSGVTPMLLTVCAAATIAIIGARALSNYLATVAFALAGSRIATALRQRVFTHVNRLSKKYHSRARTGDVVQRLVADVGRLQEVAVSAGMPLLVNLFTIVVMTGVMFWLDAWLALVVLAAAAVFFLMSRTSTKKITSASRKTRKAEGDLANLAQETLGGITVVQAYGLETTMEEQFSGSNAKSLKDGVQARRLAAALERRTDVVVGCATAAVLVLGATRVTQGAMTPGDLVIFLTYLKTAMKPLRDLAKYVGRIARAAASGERVADLLDERPDITSPPKPRQIERVRGQVDLYDVRAEYDGHQVLNGIDLHIPAGQKIALVGPSGSGKSTITSLLVRMMDPSGGSVQIDGVDLRLLDLEQLRAQVALVLQDSVLFSGTVLDNIRMGNMAAGAPQIRKAVRSAQAADFISRLPDGFSTKVGERGATLSGGQRQRIAIARALLRDSPVVILDEATTGLDPENSAAVLEAIETLSQGRTTIMVTHDEATARACDRVVWIEDGRIAWDGPGDGDIPYSQALRSPSPRRDAQDFASEVLR